VTGVQTCALPILALLPADGAAEAERLDGRAEASGEADRVRQVPAVQAEALLVGVEAVGLDHLRHPEIRGGVGGVGAGRVLEGPGPAEVVLGAGAADRGEVLV